MTTRGQLFNGQMVRAIIAGDKTETRRPITKSNSHPIAFWSSQLGDGIDDPGLLNEGTGGMGGFADLDWDAHVMRPGAINPKCTPRCSGRDYCCTFVDGDPRDGGQYLHVPGVGGETRQRVRAHVEPGDQLYVREFIRPWNAVQIQYMADEELRPIRSESGRAWFAARKHPTRGVPSIHMPKWAARINLRVTTVHAEKIQDITHAGALAEGIEPDAPGFSARVPFARLWDSIYADRGLGWADNVWCWVVKFEVMP